MMLSKAWIAITAELLFFGFWKYMIAAPRLKVLPIANQTSRQEFL